MSIYVVGSSRNKFLSLDGFHKKFLVDEKHEGDATDCTCAENLLAVAREDEEHHCRKGDKRDAPARQYAPGRAAVLDIREAEEVSYDGVGLVECEVATNL